MSLQWDRERLRLLDELRSRGVNPYPHKFQLTHTIAELRRLASHRPDKPHEPFLTGVSTAGRVANIRRHGRASFVDIFDEGERIQLYLRVNDLGDRYEDFLRYVGRGDIIGVRGDLFYTMKGELSILVRDYQLLAKALVEPPDWTKLTPEFRYAHRYVDFLYNDEARRLMELRFNVIREVRQYLYSKGFMEVETPILQPVYGGALARPFTTRVNALDEEWYLRISLELYLKRFIVGGFNKVFEIGKVFRNEDIDVTHNPEFTMLELYWAYADYNDVMDLTEDMVRTVAMNVLGSATVNVLLPGGDSAEVDLGQRFRRATMFELLSQELGRDLEQVSDEEMRALLDRYGLVPRGGVYSRGLMIEKLFDKLVAPRLIQPTFVTDYPIETTPLCKPHRSKPGLVERFELYVGGVELANAYTELNDPVLQDQLFREEQEMRKRGDQEAHPYDVDFVRALSYGMPPTGGLGVGIDRLIMMLAGVNSIKEVLPFPMVSRRTIQGD